ncbi:MAG TPA: hypothetical protein VM597_09900, partial [Gemmataceae bacterium]|nr:hypothetical protein [Gemmataceae bacterium]
YALTDLAPLADLPLEHLFIGNTGVKDLRPLAKMPLKRVNVPAVPAAELDRLRDIKTLQTINFQPVAEFWKEQEAKKP